VVTLILLTIYYTLLVLKASVSQGVVCAQCVRRTVCMTAQLSNVHAKSRYAAEEIILCSLPNDGAAAAS